MNNDNLELTGAEELVKKFTELTGREQTKAKNTALKKGSDILVKAARQSLRTVTKGYNIPCSYISIMGSDTGYIIYHPIAHIMCSSSHENNLV